MERPLVKSLAKKLGAGPTPVHPALLTAAGHDGSNAAVPFGILRPILGRFGPRMVRDSASRNPLLTGVSSFRRSSGHISGVLLWSDANPAVQTRGLCLADEENRLGDGG